MSKKYCIQSGKPQPPTQSTIQKKPRSSPKIIAALLTLTSLTYAYIFAADGVRPHENEATYEHLSGTYITGLGDASHVFAQAMENSVVSGILGLEYMNDTSSVYTFNFEN